MIDFIFITINALIAAFIWYRVGRHKAFVELYKHLTEVSQELGKVSQLLDAYRMPGLTSNGATLKTFCRKEVRRMTKEREVKK